jgi:hypothetical protein
MSYFTETLSYQLADTIGFRLSAYNNKGVSDYNQQTNSTSAIAKQAPVEMLPVTRGEHTTEHLLQIQWSALTTDSDTGHSDILSYALEYRVATDPWVIVIGDPDMYTGLEVNIT